MLKEGVVDIPLKEEKAIDSMLKELARFHKKRATLHKDSSDNAICAALKEYTNEILAPKYGLDQVFWRFLFDPYSANKAGYIPFPGIGFPKELYINLAYDVPDSSEPLRNQKIDWNKVAESIYHEWVHVKQDIEVQKTHHRGMGSPMLRKMYKATAYHDMYWEQMAIARQEIEWIKRNMKRVKPQYILKWLQRQGLKSPETEMLKKENPEAYRRIMRYAIMFLLKRMAKKATKR